MKKTINQRIRKEVLYFRSDFEPSVMVRSTPQGKFFIKVRGHQEYESKEPSNITTDFVIEGKLSTKVIYESF